MTIDRRAFSAALLAGAAGSLIATRGSAATAAPTKARNVVLVHGLFGDGSCWTEVIARLQATGLNATSWRGRMARRCWSAIPFPG